MPRISSAARRALTEKRRDQILSAAARVFARKGFDRATIADIAREAGVAEGSIYNYFKSKADLLVAIPRQFVQPAAELLALEEAEPPEARLRAIAMHMTTVVQEHADLLRVLLASLPTMSRATQAKYLEQVPFFAFGILESYFREQVSAGVFRPDLDPTIAARAFPGMLFTFLLTQEVLRSERAPALNYDGVIPQIVEIFLRGVSAPASGKRRRAQTRRKS